MTDFVIAVPDIAFIPTTEGRKFPVRRVYCIGRNYTAHALEMGHDPVREDPFFFQKNPSNLNSSGKFYYPERSSNVHHEVELLIALGSGGKNIPVKQANQHIWGYAPCLDMTRRDLQSNAKKYGRPWEIGKAFEGSAPVGKLKSVEKTGLLTEGAVSLTLNGHNVQKGNLTQMIWKTSEIIAYLSSYFELQPGDVILSGTPSGVGPVVPGDTLIASIDGLDSLHVDVV